MSLARLCFILIPVLCANVNYAQVTTITALGRTATSTQTRQQPEFFQKIPLPDSLIQETNVSKNKTDLALPLNFLTITSSFGKRFHPIYLKEQMHAGVDLKAVFEPVYAFAEGKVSQAGYDSRSGNYITLLHGSNGTLSSIYAHLSCLLVSVGDRVLAGNIIGISGNTGSSTAPHLHFALKVDNRYVDPVPVMKVLIDLLRTADQCDNTENGTKNIKGK
jgi:murein DD-endopeptidase MepM/ murein hydrolase activator NlpD